MDSICLHCGTHLESSWKFCAQCGAHVPEHVLACHANAPTDVSAETQEPAPVPGAFSGLLFGLIAVPLLLIVGIMLCLTGLGAFLGVPMIFAALLAPLLGPLFGMGTAKGKFL